MKNEVPKLYSIGHYFLEFKADLIFLAAIEYYSNIMYIVNYSSAAHKGE
jgi:hypothetical protein